MDITQKIESKTEFKTYFKIMQEKYDKCILTKKLDIFKKNLETFKRCVPKNSKAHSELKKLDFIYETF